MTGFQVEGNELTLGELREQCGIGVEDTAQRTPQQRSEARVERDRRAAATPNAILAHKPNYLLFGAWNPEGYDSTLYQQAENDPTWQNDDIEVQFQLSFKVPLATDLFSYDMDIYAAYTNRSFWQMYNKENSEPFRETNHEPEIWVQFSNDWTPLWGLTNTENRLGLVHQSNGQSDPLSRSWNRIYANFIFENEDFLLQLKPWVWVYQDKISSDNPDIDDYLGHGEIRASWNRNGHVVSGMLRNQIESGFDRGAVELSWSFPVFDYKYLKGYVQYFYGYGESLIDYNQKVNRLGLGISVTDWHDPRL